MLRYVRTLMVIGCFFSSLAVRADEPVVRIQVGSKQGRESVSELRMRVWELERAVAQLQQRIYQLEAAPQQVVVQPVVEGDRPKWTCMINSQIKGTFSATAATRGEALGQVLKECGDAFWCKKDEVECNQ